MSARPQSELQIRVEQLRASTERVWSMAPWEQVKALKALQNELLGILKDMADQQDMQDRVIANLLRILDGNR